MELDLRVSVAMSMYNESEREIHEAIKSILNQSYPNIELIVVNDNPSNAILKKVEAAYSGDTRVRFIRNEKNIGLALSLNKAIEAATGKYIARMDADDISDHSRIEKEVKFIHQYQYDMVTTNSYYIDDKGNVTGKKGNLPTKQHDIETLLKWGSFICHPSVLMKKSVLEKLGGYRCFKTAQDYDLWLRMITAGYKIGVLDEPLLYYRYRDNSLSAKNKVQRQLIVQYEKKLYRERLCGESDSFCIEDYEAVVKRSEKLAAIPDLVETQDRVMDSIKNRNVWMFAKSILVLRSYDRELFAWAIDLCKYYLYRRIKKV